MTILAARFLPGFRTRILLLGTCVLFAGSAQVARADFLSSRIEGTQFWMPPGVQGPEPIASLHSPVRGGLLRIKSTRIRDEAELDLLGGRMVVYRRYGSVDMAPVWVEDLRTMIGAAAVHSAREVWMDVLRRETSARRGDQHAGLISIDIPVEFPDALADIIGQGARLNLTGSERITFSGTSNIIEGGPTYESGNPSAFPDLDMKQHLKLNLDGTIGRKIHVLVNHDSEVSTDLDNKIQLRYDGDEDEIVQKIEMGNTDLSLPGSEFLSFRKSQQGLFGAKAQGSLGPLDLTVIASKQEGKTASQTFVGRARRDSVTVRDIDYIKRQYFWIDTPEVLAMNSDPGDGAAVLPLGGEGFDLFMDDRDAQNNFTNTFIANAWIDVVDTTSANFTGFFTRLEENVDYQVDRQSGNVVLTRPLDDRYALAAHYVRASGDSVGALSVAEGDTISLKLLRPPQSELDDDAKGFVRARAYEQKNIYFLGARNIVPEGFELVIRRKGATAGEPDEDIQIDEANAANNQEFVRIMGLDYRGLADDIPDLRVEPEFVDYEAGTITFPNITPFAPDSSSINVIVSPSQVSTGRSSEPGVPLAEDNGALYSLPPDELYNQDRYYIETKYTTPTPTYSLNRFNILEGSERVHLNGRLLNRGSDYDIDYDYGILTFRTADASLPDAEISVDFEFVPLFGQAKESLLGLSGTYNFGPRTHLSSSLLFFTKATPEERPKLGQEPTRTFVGNLYGQWVKEPDFLTSLANAIPLVRTDAKSDVQLQGEVAFSMPNPNTKNQIYIDDMEGVEDSRELSLARGTWHPASEPVGMEYLPRTVFNWYNPENVVRRKDVYPQVADEREGQDFIQILEFRTRETASPDSSWVGIMRNLSMTGEDYTEKKFVEIWVDDLGGYEGVMTFDIGEISEDHYLESEGLQKGRGFLDTEDFDPFDGSLTVSREDLGLDNVQGTDGSGSEGDDGDDDFFFERTSTPDYTQINGTEGNSRLDTEDTDGDNFLDTDNKYLSFEIDLSDTLGSPYLVQRNSEVTGEADNYWRLYRIPIDDGVPVGGVVRRKAVKYARLWFEGLSEDAGVKARVASIKIVGAAWVEEAMATNDTVEPVPESEDAGSFLINVKNTKEDDDYFPPFDPGKDQSNEEKREQSLVVQYSEIPSGSVTEGRQGSAYKEILDTGDGTSTNFTQYETMSFYLRDGARDRAGAVRPGFDPVEGSTGTFFFRFGADTLNFYEFATVPDSSWQEVNIPLDELAVLKLDAPETTLTVEGAVVEYREMIVDGDTLSVYGAPSLTRVRRMTVGVRGDDPARPEVSGEVWFDEIRLRSVKKKRGAAARLHGSARVADLLTLDGGIRRVGSEFRRIEGERHGSDEFSWNARGDLKLNKFI
ncbi:MAG: hypothetical protein QGI43_09720, partial [Gemmatimonadota bacterium]|nr:hypothetical protein [Gemmatimonadota bacterium]